MGKIYNIISVVQSLKHIFALRNLNRILERWMQMKISLDQDINIDIFFVNFII